MIITTRSSTTYREEIRTARNRGVDGFAVLVDELLAAVEHAGQQYGVEHQKIFAMLRRAQQAERQVRTLTGPGPGD
jgi:hypothetical protein